MIVVTGGSGKAGRAVVHELLEHGDEVLSVDLVRSPDLACEQIPADLTDFGQTADVLRGAEAVVHLAAIPAPGLRPDELTFRVNTTSTYNVFSAAPMLGLRRVVWASSETVLGLPFERERPAYARSTRSIRATSTRATSLRRAGWPCTATSAAPRCSSWQPPTP